MKKNDKQTKTSQRAIAILKDKQLTETSGGVFVCGKFCGLLISLDPHI